MCVYVVQNENIKHDRVFLFRTDANWSFLAGVNGVILTDGGVLIPMSLPMQDCLAHDWGTSCDQELRPTLRV